MQNFKVDMESLDLLSPAGLRDLKALQSSGLSNIHYPGFLIQVSRGPLRPDRCRTEGPEEELEGCISPCPGPGRGVGGGLSPDHVAQTMCGVPILLGWGECPPNPRVCRCPWF